MIEKFLGKTFFTIYSSQRVIILGIRLSKHPLGYNLECMKENGEILKIFVKSKVDFYKKFYLDCLKYQNETAKDH
jgi:hypothetical protein